MRSGDKKHIYIVYFLCISEKKILTTKFTENITRVLLHEYEIARRR